MARPLLVVAIWAALSAAANADDDDAGLAQRLANPIAALMSFPVTYNWDHDIGATDEGHSYYIKTEPLIPLRLNEDWTVIARTVLLAVDQHNVDPGSGTQLGITETTESFFLTPNKAGPDGLLWGLGPTVSLPATSTAFGSQRWGLGPTAALVMQPGQWTIGILASHVWSIGEGDGGNVNQTYLQPFISYTTKDAVTFTLESESFYYWNDGDWAIPLHAEVTKLFRLGGQAISVGPAARYWAADTASGAHNWGFRFTTTLLFPDK
jgi:hypothetical protein